MLYDNSGRLDVLASFQTLAWRKHMLLSLIWYFFVMVCLFAMMCRSATAGLILAIIVFFFIARSALKNKPRQLAECTEGPFSAANAPKRTHKKPIAKASR